MLCLRALRRTLPMLTTAGGLVAGALVAGCGSERTEPLPAEAKTPGQLRPPNLARDKQPLAKNVNLKAPSSIKELQTKP
jgi:hypothetical protein